MTTRCIGCLAGRLALAFLAATAPGCGNGETELASAGPADIRLGSPVPENLRGEVTAHPLGVGVRAAERDWLAGETKVETVRAVVDRNGRVVARHALRTVAEGGMLGDGGVREIGFVLDARLPAPVGGTAGGGPDADLLALARAAGVEGAPYPAMPRNWDGVTDWLLQRLNRRRQARLTAPAGELPSTPADLVLIAEILLEGLDVPDAEHADMLIWRELRFGEAVGEVARALPGRAGGRHTWSRIITADVPKDGEWNLLSGLFEPAETAWRVSGSLTNMGEGHVRLELSRMAEAK